MKSTLRKAEAGTEYRGSDRIPWTCGSCLRLEFYSRNDLIWKFLHSHLCSSQCDLRFWHLKHSVLLSCSLHCTAQYPLQESHWALLWDAFKKKDNIMDLNSFGGDFFEKAVGSENQEEINRGRDRKLWEELLPQVLRAKSKQITAKRFRELTKSPQPLQTPIMCKAFC